MMARHPTTAQSRSLARTMRFSFSISHTLQARTRRARRPPNIGLDGLRSAITAALAPLYRIFRVRETADRQLRGADHMARRVAYAAIEAVLDGKSRHSRPKRRRVPLGTGGRNPGHTMPLEAGARVLWGKPGDRLSQEKPVERAPAHRAVLFRPQRCAGLLLLVVAGAGCRQYRPLCTSWPREPRPIRAQRPVDVGLRRTLSYRGLIANSRDTGKNPSDESPVARKMMTLRSIPQAKVFET